MAALDHPRFFSALTNGLVVIVSSERPGEETSGHGDHLKSAPPCSASSKRSGEFRRSSSPVAGPGASTAMRVAGAAGESRIAAPVADGATGRLIAAAMRRAPALAPAVTRAGADLGPRLGAQLLRGEVLDGQYCHPAPLGSAGSTRWR